jgi:membrane associated rhomboid family serine protease
VPLVVIPIRTEAAVRGSPLVNYWIIAINIAAFLVFGTSFAGEAVQEFARQHLYFRSYPTQFHHFFTYQFLHGDAGHLLGNMLFLWVFGNSVCGKMGGGPYLLFYLACGVFAAWVNAMLKTEPFFLIGASGSIAGVTTAYLALFPRSYVTVLVWVFFFIQFFEFPAMILIGLKIIVWDNVLAPRFSGGGDQVAYLAHLGGYLFGFVGALAMLMVRGIARDQFDILALWGRWRRRQGWDGPAVGKVERVATIDPEKQKAEALFFDQIADLRSRIAEDIVQRATGAALEQYEKLQAISAGQVLPETVQLEIAREYYRRGQFPAAVQAFGRFVECYPEAGETPNIRLLSGIIHARDLQQYEVAERLLSDSMRGLRDDERREQCLLWLRNVRTALGKNEPDLAH